MYTKNLSLHDNNGNRKYLNNTERLKFLECSGNCRTDKKLFCQLLFFTGARICEIHNLTTSGIDLLNKSVVLKTLKKRQQNVFREIPLPDTLLKSLEIYIDDLKPENKEPHSLWSFSLRTASRHIKSVMHQAQITGVRSCARGLRHGFAVNAVDKAPITLVKKWLGHSSLETTEIYLDVIGSEERKFAQKIWLQ